MRRIVDMRDPPALTFFPANRVEEIVQNIYCVLGTQRGSVPCYREFGVSSDWLHRPINVAQSAYAVALTQAIRTYEPRAKVERVRFEADGQHPDHLYPVLEVTINESV